ncbi:succinate-semialdehyde dehydrogenase [Photobacterium aphoticum]|uniref:Succinate-semialdehyde dehydrogenase n=1 Tax=Photobacterium aphoticum TaxID=754436 RepID=A0A090QHC9_9GAMM|nr:succinate-semialdehyde dehydrogenase [Photobacterium aphoticum]
MKLMHSALFKQACYVAGQWVTAHDGATDPVINPSTGQIIAQVPRIGREMTLAAIDAAQQAQQQWKQTTAKAALSFCAAGMR